MKQFYYYSLRWYDGEEYRANGVAVGKSYVDVMKKLEAAYDNIISVDALEELSSTIKDPLDFGLDLEDSMKPCKS